MKYQAHCISRGYGWEGPHRDILREARADAREHEKDSTDYTPGTGGMHMALVRSVLQPSDSE